MKGRDVQFSSEAMDWGTPQWLFDWACVKFGTPILDVCANKDNTKCANYFSLPDFDGLKQDWSKYGTCWMNPPYGRGIGVWMEKAYNEGQKGAKVICLTFARTDTKWWHDWVTKAAEIYFLKGRVKFVKGEETNSAPYPSCIILFYLTAKEPIVKFVDPKRDLTPVQKPV